MSDQQYRTVANVTVTGLNKTITLESELDQVYYVYIKPPVPLANVVNHVEEMLSRY